MGQEADKKCIRIFDGAVHKREFGNGRFARNLLEQAMMKQSIRIMNECREKKISREEIMELTAEDFEVNLRHNVKSGQHTIGFLPGI